LEEFVSYKKTILCFILALGLFPAVFSKLGLFHAGFFPVDFFPAGMDFFNYFYFEKFQEK